MLNHDDNIDVNTILNYCINYVLTLSGVGHVKNEEINQWSIYFNFSGVVFKSIATLLQHETVIMTQVNHYTNHPKQANKVGPLNV